ncbi:hypothetical protein T492DRAFT_30151 [Pavlovales sp. CCMP2436]|nr:hypothetical protein T492DRAFT_30151 [Pavlovales sp. CCMP2436]
MLACELGIPVSRMRLWTWVKRQYRPNVPLQLGDETSVQVVDDEEEEVILNHRMQAELNLYLEVVDQETPPLCDEDILLFVKVTCPSDVPSLIPPITAYSVLSDGSQILLFSPHPLPQSFDAAAQTVSFVGTQLARTTDRLADLEPDLRRMKGLPESCEIDIYEEVIVDVYEEIEFESLVVRLIGEGYTLQEAELQHGDIIVFQTRPPHSIIRTQTDGELDAQTVPAFFYALKNREREPPERPLKRAKYAEVAIVGCDPAQLAHATKAVQTLRPAAARFRTDAPHLSLVLHRLRVLAVSKVEPLASAELPYSSNEPALVCELAQLPVEPEALVRFELLLAAAAAVQRAFDEAQAAITSSSAVTASQAAAEASAEPDGGVSAEQLARRDILRKECAEAYARTAEGLQAKDFQREKRELRQEAQALRNAAAQLRAETETIRRTWLLPDCECCWSDDEEVDLRDCYLSEVYASAHQALACHAAWLERVDPARLA